MPNQRAICLHGADSRSPVEGNGELAGDRVCCGHWAGRLRMALLLFKKEFRAAIREGRKRTTLRRWKVARVRAGSRAFAPGVGWLVIEEVESIEHLRLLKIEDARADGFASRAQMTRALRELYPAKMCREDGRMWFRVRFRLERPAH
jgi:hypothetical protein